MVMDTHHSSISRHELFREANESLCAKFRCLEKTQLRCPDYRILTHLLPYPHPRVFLCVFHFNDGYFNLKLDYYPGLLLLSTKCRPQILSSQRRDEANVGAEIYGPPKNSSDAYVVRFGMFCGERVLSAKTTQPWAYLCGVGRISYCVSFNRRED